MASKFSKQFSIPEGFPEILRDFTREILRTQADDINMFGAQYFSEMLERRDGIDRDDSKIVLSLDEVHEHIQRMFHEADKDQNGFLDRKELKSVIDSFKKELGLSKKDVKRVLSEADENNDGNVEYGEFIPLAADLISTLIAKRKNEQDQAARKEQAKLEASQFLLKGMPQQELEGILTDVFKKADKNGDGSLDRNEFRACLKDANLGFTRKEINLMLTEVDTDGDGRVTYDEFIPLCLHILTEMVADEMSSVPPQEAEMAAYFSDLFTQKAGDAKELHFRDVIKLLKDADLGLTLVQIHSIMSEADRDPQTGMVDYEKLATTAAGLVVSLLNIEMQSGRVDKVSEIHGSEQYQLMFGQDQASFQSALFGAFEATDAEGTGVLSSESVEQCIAQVSPGISPKQMQAIMSLAADQEGDMISYHVIADQAFPVLQFLVEQEMIGNM
jgi:Ca2+-binding EF-hand superfamily protein